MVGDILKLIEEYVKCMKLEEYLLVIVFNIGVYFVLYLL